MKTKDDPLQRCFAVLRHEPGVPNVDLGLERRLLREMKEFPARRRRLRIVAVTLGIAMFCVVGGVQAAGGFQAIQNWLSEVRAIEFHFGPEDDEPRVLMRNEAGDVVGQGRLPPPDENGDYRARIHSNGN